MNPALELSVNTAAYLLYCIIETVIYRRNYSEGNICWFCCKQNLIDLWLAFFTFCPTSIVSLIFNQFAMPLMPPFVGMPLQGLVSLLSFGLTSTVIKFGKMFSSPFPVDCIKVSAYNQLNCGDVISFCVWRLGHTCIVSDVDKEQSRIRVIHYAPNFMPKYRKIIEEYISLDLEKKRYIY